MKKLLVLAMLVLVTQVLINLYLQQLPTVKVHATDIVDITNGVMKGCRGIVLSLNKNETAKVIIRTCPTVPANNNSIDTPIDYLKVSNENTNGI